MAAWCARCGCRAEGNKTKHLNGSSGRLVAHPRSGHPTFICKDKAPDQPILTLCVALDGPAANRGKRVLLDGKYLLPYDAHMALTITGLHDALLDQEPANLARTYDEQVHTPGLPDLAGRLEAMARAL